LEKTIGFLRVLVFVFLGAWEEKFSPGKSNSSIKKSPTFCMSIVYSYRNNSGMPNNKIPLIFRRKLLESSNY